MRQFTQEDVGKDVVDRNGEPLGTVAGIEDGQARLHPETGVESRMAASADRDPGTIEVHPDQVEETTADWIRIHVPE